ncbi:hypothetical protein ADIS_2359 [Lunatimonas lonarensis]|uniref:Uncharacterized protein n=1 Tax=Lunatimonas lonarensis TaxID=1232681 RepID=R7ZT34_9BACT|nr:hypothetical protein ADIS_2359 [Lunatimonas lonarensis]
MKISFICAVVNCFQNCTLRGKSQQVDALKEEERGCELLSKLYLKG